MSFIIVITVLALAAIYGLFFLIFKLIALLFKKPGFKMPLILAGVATFIVGILAGVAVYKLYQRIMLPFEPIVQTIQTQKHPIYGQRLYIDPTYGFTVTQYNGTVFSKWIDVGDVNLLVGLDTNDFLRQKENSSSQDVTLFFLIRQDAPANVSAEQLMQNILPKLKEQNSDVQTIILADPQTIDLGENTTGSILSVVFHSPQLPENGLPASLLIVIHEGKTYYFTGLTTKDQQIMLNTLTSFRPSI